MTDQDTRKPVDLLILADGSGIDPTLIVGVKAYTEGVSYVSPDGVEHIQVDSVIGGRLSRSCFTVPTRTEAIAERDRIIEARRSALAAAS